MWQKQRLFSLIANRRVHEPTIKKKKKNNNKGNGRDSEMLKEKKKKKNIPGKCNLIG